MFCKVLMKPLCRLNKVTALMLRELARVHQKISDSMHSINETCSLSIMSALGIGFTKCCIFIFLLSISSQKFWLNFYLYGILNCYLHCFLLLLVIVIFYACESTRHQHNETLNILFKHLMNTRHECSDLDKKASFQYLEN